MGKRPVASCSHPVGHTGAVGEQPEPEAERAGALPWSVTSGTRPRGHTGQGGLGRLVGLQVECEVGLPGAR